MLKNLKQLFLCLFLLEANKIMNNSDSETGRSDKVSGRCQSYRQFTKVQKEICESKVRAAGPDGEIGDPINITEIIDRFNNPDKVIYAGNAVNQFLWNGSLAVLSDYPLKNCY